METETMRTKKEKGSSAQDKSLNSKKRACQECKKAKKKCFGGHPCERCVRRGMEELCLFPEPAPVISFMPYNSPSSSSSSSSPSPSSSASSFPSSTLTATTATGTPASYSSHTFNLSSPLPTPPAPSPIPSHFPSLYDLPRFSPISPPGSASLSPLSHSQSPSPSPTSLSSLSSPTSLYHSLSPLHSLSLSPSSPSSSAHNSPHALPTSQFHSTTLPSFPTAHNGSTYHSQSATPPLLHPLPQMQQQQQQQQHHADMHHPLPFVFPQPAPSSTGYQLPSLSSLSLPSPSVFPAQPMATSPEELRPSLFASSTLIPPQAHKKRRSALNALCPRRFFRPENKNPVGPGS